MRVSSTPLNSSPEWIGYFAPTPELRYTTEVIVTLSLAAVLIIAGLAIAVSQIALYRRAKSEAYDLFVYSSRRLRIRITGAVLLGLIGTTFALWEVGSAMHMSATSASRLVSVLIGEVIILLVIAGLDFRETGKTAGRHPHEE